jgi:hypothetical protein
MSSQLGSRFAKNSFAGSAAPALDAPFAVGSEPLAGLVLASLAGHGLSPLDFCGESHHNLVGSGLRLTPRSGLAPQPVSAGSGALNVNGYELWWTHGNLHRGTVRSEVDGDRDYHCVPAFPNALLTQGVLDFNVVSG